jgi:Tol biopolymer transport system component
VTGAKLGAIATLAAALLAMFATAAWPAKVRERTVRLAEGVNGTDADGFTRQPALNGRGTLVAFASAASNLTLDLNGRVEDVFLRDMAGNRTRVVSEGVGGVGSDGPSDSPVIDGPGDRVAFVSAATNLVRGDANGHRDVFARQRFGPVERVSVAADGGDPNGTSFSPDISGDGTRIAFVSDASNLVAGDTDGAPDVFVRDLTAGTTTLVAAGTAPAISPDGRYVSYFAEANVFLKDLQTGKVTLVSVSSSGRRQNKSVIEPFAQVSDVSKVGLFVAFDSDATNLVRGDRNRDTDVFVRDVRRRTTARVSLDVSGREGDNDSFFPRITPDGRYVAFESFAGNLSQDDAPREDVFVYDRGRFAPSLVDVGDIGQRRRPERIKQLLQRPAITNDGTLAAFTTTAGNLVPGDRNGREDAFLRIMRRPSAKILAGPSGVVRTRRPFYRLGADDRRARRFICSLETGRIPCGRSGRLPALRPGPHVFNVRAGGAGMLFQDVPVTRKFFVAG